MRLESQTGTTSLVYILPCSSKDSLLCFSYAVAQVFPIIVAVSDYVPVRWMYPHKVKLAGQVLSGQIKTLPKVTTPIANASFLILVQTFNDISARTGSMHRIPNLSGPIAQNQVLYESAVAITPIAIVAKQLTAVWV